ncbi:MAG: nicotinate-nucleotide adenylyltransferase [Syntrophorhabdus sp.]
MAVGIFGGTFNPVHVGHLRVAEEIREEFRLDNVYFIPAHLPPHKDSGVGEQAPERLEILKAAVKGNKYFKVSDIEIRRGGVSYTIETLKKLERRFDDIYFIIGLDAFKFIDTWYHWEDLFSHTHFIVMTRPASSVPDISHLLPSSIRSRFTVLENNTCRHESGKMIYLRPVTKIDVSSTQVRMLVRGLKSIKYLVPPAVEKIILGRGLYRS